MDLSMTPAECFTFLIEVLGVAVLSVEAPRRGRSRR